MKKCFSWPCKLLASFFYIGYSPIAPGTTASIASALLLFFMPTLRPSIFLVVLFALFAIGVFVAKQFSLELNQPDPSVIVIDEWFGMWLSLFLVPKTIWLYGLAFLLFRFFDIAKPFPINYLEKKIQGGLGIMLDDALAGLSTVTIVHIVISFTTT